MLSNSSRKKRRRRSYVQEGPRPTIEDFYKFMVARETLRRKKELFPDDQSKWTTDPILRKYKFTNVKREHDRTTRGLRALTDKRKRVWLELGSESERDKEAGFMVFNCALQRQFGTVTFANAMGYVTDWNPESAVQTCLSVLNRGGYCFTEGYRPQSIHRNSEHTYITKRRSDDPPFVADKPLKWYKETCDRLTEVWKIRDELAKLAKETKSWEVVVNRLAKVKGFGGTSTKFHAKECVQDMLHTIVFQRPPRCSDGNYTCGTWKSVCKDLDTYSPVGPGARQGLNRLSTSPSRDVEWGRYLKKHEEKFMEEMKEIYAKAEDLWPASLVGKPNLRLELHDIQFQLCEFDKYLRIKSGAGRKPRLYKYNPSVHSNLCGVPPQKIEAATARDSGDELSSAPSRDSGDERTLVVPGSGLKEKPFVISSSDEEDD